MPNIFDVSHITGKSNAGNHNDWTTWHSAVNNQVPFYLQARPQLVKPSVSLNAGVNVLYNTKNPTNTNPSIDIPSNDPKDATTVVATPQDLPWWQEASKWLLGNFVIPTVKNVQANPVKATLDLVNPSSSVLGIIGKGDALAGALTVMEVPKKIATSTFINIGRSAQGLRQTISGETPQTDYLTDMQNAWNWGLQEQGRTQAIDAAGNPAFELDGSGYPKLDSKGNPVPLMVDLHDNIDVGTAFMYSLGQTAGIVVSPLERFTSEEEKAELNKMSNDWGFTFSNSNFDIFNHDQIDQITGVERDDAGVTIGGTGNGWTLGNVLTQTFNFAGDLGLDPLTYVPFGKVGSIAFAGRTLTNTSGKEISKRVIKDATIMTAAAEGKQTVYNNFLNFVAKNNATKIRNHVVLKSITTGERERVAYLLGEVTTPEDAAKVFLAVEYGSVRAQQELLRDYSKISLAIDHINDGGYLNRMIKNGKLAPENDLLEGRLHTVFYGELMKYTDDIVKSPFASALKDTAYRINTIDLPKWTVSEFGVAAGTGAIRELTPVNIKNAFVNRLINQLEATGARTSAFFVNGLTDAGHLAVESPFKYGVSDWIHHQIVRLGSTDAKGVIDVTNIDNIASNKFYGSLNDIDRITKGQLSKVRVNPENQASYTLKAKFTEDWMRSTSALERAKLVEDLNQVSLELLATKYGADDAIKKIIVDELTKKRRIFSTNLNETGISVLTQDGRKIVYTDPYMIGRGNTEISMWNWNKIDQAFKQNENALFNIGYGTADMVGNIYKELNGLFNALVVTRGSRFFRDIIANTITSLGSGYARDMLTHLRPMDAVKNSLNKAKNIGDLSEPLVVRRGNVRDTVGAISKLEEEYTAIENVVDVQYQRLVDQLATVPITSVNGEEIASYLVAKEILNRRTVAHTSPLPLGAEVNQDRVLVSWNNESDAVDSVVSKYTEEVQTAITSRAGSTSMPEGTGTIPKTTQELIDAYRQGDIIHIRGKGKNATWNLFTPNQRLSEKDIIDSFDLTAREYRIFGKDEFTLMSMDELKSLISSATESYYYIPTNKVTQTLKKITLEDINNGVIKEVPEKILKVNTPFEVYYPYVYGTQLSKFSFIGEPENAMLLERDLYELAEAWVNKPVKGTEKNILEQMRELNIGSIQVTDAQGKLVTISNPDYTVLRGVNGDQSTVLTNALNAQGFGFVERRGINDAALRRRARQKRADNEMVGDSPFTYYFDSEDLKNIVPMPRGWTLISKPAEGYKPRFFVQFGGVSRKEYAVRIVWDVDSKRPHIKFLKPVPKKELEKAGTLIDEETGKATEIREGISTDTWYRLQAEPSLTVGDVIGVRDLKKITSKSKESISKVSEEQNLLDAAANFGTFNPSVLSQLDSYVSRLSEISRQLWHLHDNLSKVTEKISKRDRALLEEARRKLAQRGITEVAAPPRKYADQLMEDMRIAASSENYMGQMFGDALLGVDGSKWYAKISKDSAEVRAQGTGFFTSGDRVINRVVEPGEAGYWEAWLRTLNEHWRNADGSDLDPVIRMIIKEKSLGQTDETVANLVQKWMTSSPAGIKYAKEIGVGADFANFNHGIYRRPKTRFEQMTTEDYIDMQMANVNQHVGVISKSFEDETGEVFAGNMIAAKLIKNQPITLEDLIKANLKRPSQFRTTMDAYINPETGNVELLDIAGDFKNLPSIWGTMTDPVSRRGVVEQSKYVLQQINRVIADIPQEIIFQKPMFRAAYQKSLERLTTQMRISTGKDYFSQSEIMGIEEKARSFALAETRKWIYSTTSTPNIMNGIRAVVPFANATVFTAKWMANVAKERPLYVAWMVYEYNKAINGTQWFDKNGNAVNYDAKDADGNRLATHFKGNYAPGLLNILAGKSWDDPWAKNYVDSSFISRTSVDPIFNGNNVSLFGVNVPNPFINWGLSPAPAMAMSELIKASYNDPNSLFGVVGKFIKDFNDNAQKTGLLPDLLPFGVSPTQNSLGLLIPGQAAKMVVDDQKLIKLQLDAAIYLYGRYAAGLGPLPTSDLVNDVAKGWFDLENNTSLFLPFATKYVTGPDMARQTWQTYLKDEQDAYDKLGPEEYTKRNLPGMRSFKQRVSELPGAKPYYLTPFDVARSKFMMEKADLFFGAISQNSSDLNISPQESTAKNLIKYKGLIPQLTTTSEGTDIASDILNDASNSSTSPQPYKFSQDVYNILIDRGLIAQSTVEEVARKTLIGKGNQVFRTGIDINKDGKINEKDGDILGMNELDNLAYERNLPIDLDPELATKKQRLVKWISRQPEYGQQWADSRSTLNPQRFNNSAEAWDLVVGDISWQTATKKSNESFYTTATYYLERRKFYQTELRKRSQVDPTLGTLAKNPDIRDALINEVFYLKNYDKTGKFSEWYNNYFEGDTIN